MGNDGVFDLKQRAYDTSETVKIQFSKAFLQQSLLAWEDVVQAKIPEAVASANQWALPGGEVDILKLFTFMASDVVAELCVRKPPRK